MFMASKAFYCGNKRNTLEKQSYAQTKIFLRHIEISLLKQFILKQKWF